jgi:hypothetical protein
MLPWSSFNVRRSTPGEHVIPRDIERFGSRTESGHKKISTHPFAVVAVVVVAIVVAVLHSNVDLPWYNLPLEENGEHR